jgi:hypothetical protein
MQSCGVNMKVDNVSDNINKASFKGLYALRGQADILDDICSYYGRIQRRTRDSEKAFHFLSIRSPQPLKPSGGVFHVSIKNGRMSVTQGNPVSSLKDGKSFFDLFVTEKDEQLAEPVMRNMVEDTIAITQQGKPLARKVRILLDNLNELDERMHEGKTIVNIIPTVLKNYLPKVFDLSSLREIPAEDAYNGLREGHFNILEGTLQ